jgi:hypothetical protein
MPAPGATFGWQEAMLAFGVIAVAAFLVTWVTTDLLHVRRTPYIAILAVTVGGLLAGYLLWSGTSLEELITSNWAWGITAGVVAAAIATPLIRRLPSEPRPVAARLIGMVAWEGFVYGAAEAVLLATLPVLAIWQATADAGWTDGGWVKVGAGGLAIVGALLTILVHHLGYASFRRASARPMMLGALFTCGTQALAFLLTGNILAPVIAHIVLHTQLVFHGVEMPPEREQRHVKSSSQMATRTLETSTRRAA